MKEICLTFALFCIVLASACAKKSDGGSAGAPPVEKVSAKVLIENVEDKFNSFVAFYNCTRKVEEKQVGVELKQYTVALACPEPKTLSDLNSRLDAANLILDYIKPRKPGTDATLSQENLVRAYEQALNSEAGGMRALKMAVLNSENDDAYKAELARMKSLGCVPNPEEFSYRINCENRATIDEIQNQIRSLKAMLEILGSRNHRLRLNDKYSSTVWGYERAMRDGEERIKAVKIAKIADFTKIAELLKTRFNIVLKAYKQYSTELYNDPREAAAINRAEDYVYPFVINLLDILNSGSADQLLAGKGLTEIRLRFNDYGSRCEINPDEPAIVTLCETDREAIAKRLAEYLTTADKQLLERVKKHRLLSIWSDGEKFQCGTTSSAVTCVKVARIVDSVLATKTALSRKTAISVASYRDTPEVKNYGDQYFLYVSGKENESDLKAFFEKELR